MKKLLALIILIIAIYFLAHREPKYLEQQYGPSAWSEGSPAPEGKQFSFDYRK